MKNILLFAGTISPYRGSECSVAWNFVTQMNKDVNLHVLYLYDDSKEEVEHYLRNHELNNVHFHYCGGMPQNWVTKNVFYNIYVFYAESKKLHNNVLKKAQEIVSNYDIDLVHFLNPIGFKEPGYLWKLKKPYVWGPVQAVANWPIYCCPLLSLRGWLEFFMRVIFHNIHFHFNHRVKAAFRRSEVVVAATKDSQKMIEKTFGIKALYRPENALISIEADKPISFNPLNDPLNIIVAGSLDDRKCLKLFLRAMVQLKKKNLLNNIRLHVCGSGYLSDKLKKFCEKEAIQEAIIWHGRLSREETQKIFKKSHLHVITSLGEATTTVLWEAMSKGIPTLSLNHCGMGSVLTEDSSFLIKVRPLNKMINDIDSAIQDIIRNPAMIAEKSQKTLDLAKNFLWQEQVKFFNNCYDHAVSRFEEKNRGYTGAKYTARPE